MAHETDRNASDTTNGTGEDNSITTPSSPSTKVSPLVEKNVTAEQHAGTLKHEELTKTRKYILGLVLSITLFAVALEQTIATAALPQITAALGAEGYSWIGTAYLLASAAVMPVYGKLSDIWGRKPLMTVAIVLFTVGSAISGAAQSMNMLIAGRAIMGNGGGIAGLINTIISDLVPLNERGLFMGYVGTTWMLASGVGPIISGALTNAGAWRFCFYLTVFIGGGSLVAMWLILRINSPTTTASQGLKRIDFVGILLSAGATCLLLIALDWGGTVYAWNSKLIICFLVFSGALIIVFLVYEKFVPSEPVIPPRLFTQRTRAASYAASFFHAISFMGIIYYLPFMFQAVYGVSPLIASCYVIPEAVLMGMTSALGGWIISRFSRYVEMQRIGMAATTAFIGLLSTLSSNSNTAQRIIYPTLYGMPIGFNFQSFLISLQTKIQRKDIGVATATFAYTRQIGLSLGVAIGGVAFQNKITSLANASGDERLVKLLAGNAPTSVNAIKHLPPDIQATARQFYMEAFQVVFYVFIGFAGMGFLATWFIPQNELKMKDDVDKGDKETSPGSQGEYTKNESSTLSQQS